MSLGNVGCRNELTRRYFDEIIEMAAKKGATLARAQLNLHFKNV